MKPNYVRGQLRRGRKKTNLTCIVAKTFAGDVGIACYDGDRVIEEIRLSDRDAKRLARQLLSRTVRVPESGTILGPAAEWLFTSPTKLELVGREIRDLNENM